MSLVDVRTPMTAPLASFSGESVVWNQPSLPPGPIVEYSSSPGSPVSGTRCSAVAARAAAGGGRGYVIGAIGALGALGAGLFLFLFLPLEVALGRDKAAAGRGGLAERGLRGEGLDTGVDH